MKNKKNGFTLIEVLVVISVIVMSMPIFISIVFTVIRQQVQVTKLQELTNQADPVLEYVKNMIKQNTNELMNNSGNLVCNTNPANMNVVSQVSSFNMINNNQFQFGLNSGIMQMRLNGGPSLNLSSNKIQISNFLVSCIKNNTFTPPVVKISFTAISNSDSNVTMNYATYVQLLNL